MKANAFNWENCTMYVQDIKSLGTNIAADISKQEASNFKKMCCLFASENSHNDAIDAYMSKLLTSKSGSNLSLDSLSTVKSDVHSISGDSKYSLHNLKTAGCANLTGSFPNASNSNPNTVGSKVPVTNNVTKLEDVIKVGEVSTAIKTEMNQIVSRSKSRIEDENDIINLLSGVLKAYDRTIMVASFGSVTYGFGGQRTNLNILVMTGN